MEFENYPVMQAIVVRAEAALTLAYRAGIGFNEPDSRSLADLESAKLEIRAVIRAALQEGYDGGYWHGQQH